MGNPVTLFQDARGDLWYKHFRIDKICLDEAHRIGYLHGVDVAEDSWVVVSISAKPIIESMPSIITREVTRVKLDFFPVARSSCS
jgi:hypothetical protein